jgi:hypothetical protein
MHYQSSTAIYAVTSALPPAYGENPASYALVIFGLMMASMLAAEWLWDIWHQWRENPAPFGSGLWYSRIITGTLVFVLLLFAVPELVFSLGWPSFSAAEREMVAFVRANCRALAGMLFSVAWLMGERADYIINWDFAHVRSRPLKRFTGPERRKTLVLLGGAFVIAIGAAIYPFVKH